MRTAGFAARMGLLRQLGLSITATVVATMIISGIRGEVAWLRGAAVQSAPDLTMGGKFAARVQALRESDPEPTITPPVPMLVADAAFRAVPISFAPAEAAGPRWPKDATKAPRRVAHADVRHRSPSDEARLVLPPKRGDSVAETATARGLSAAAAGDEDGLWSTTRTFAKQTLALGGSALDRINPLNLIP